MELQVASDSQAALCPGMSLPCRLAARLATRGFHRAVSTGTTPSSSSEGSGQRNRRDERRTGDESRRSEEGGQRNGRWNRYSYSAGAAAGAAPLLGLSWLVTIKDLLGIEKVELDKDPLKDKIKESWVQRRHGAFGEAIAVLHAALEEAKERKDQMAITRIVDELAGTYYQKGDYEEAEKCYREAIQRLVQIHGTKDSDPAFIGISLKIADLLARRGQIDHAETGLMHCLKQQMKLVDAHLAKNSVARGAMIEDRHIVDRQGPTHTDPMALFGMVLDAFAHFLVEHRDETRLKEADEYMSEVLKISYQIYGAATAHSVRLASSFGMACILKNRFELATKYLRLAVDRAAHLDECAYMLPTLYCSYAEALFHSDKKEEGIQWARRALTLTRSADEKTKRMVSQFLADLEKETGQRRKWFWFF